ncbi:hypothetical protein JZ751_017065 [Albula glossodonta]|uniref:Serpin domain-containing protein n=1 Tax=Albula glossodonta TaxID=121402 RepID=A0A8T2NXB0_9TELE|nr:hypothetical protein JZ751_017065 [Albula glossodonta]
MHTDAEIGDEVVTTAMPEPPTRAPTHDAPFETYTTPPAFTADPLQEGDSSEEEQEDCGASAKHAVGGAIMKLGLKLLQTLQTSPEQPNTIISPLSAVNETEELLLSALHADALPCYHKSLRSLLQQLHNNALQVATRLYLGPGFKVKSAFEKESMRMYKSDVVPLTGIEEVNEWVEDATKGKITNFLSSLPPNLALMLINAVHFKGQWQARFNPRFTSKELFYVDDREVVPVDMMLGPKYPLSMLLDSETDSLVARFPFKQHMSLLVVMPILGQVNVSAIAAKLNISDLYARLPRPRAMQVKLPKFKLEYSQDLQQAFISMGLGELFTGPNLAGIAEGPLLVSSVQHKSSLELNEEGAEAAAATSMVILRSNPSFTLNQPFFFALMDDNTQTPLFLGVIKNPNPEAVPMQVGGPTGAGKDKLSFADKKNGHSYNHIPK